MKNFLSGKIVKPFLFLAIFPIALFLNWEVFVLTLGFGAIFTIPPLVVAVIAFFNAIIRKKFQSGFPLFCLTMSIAIPLFIIGPSLWNQFQTDWEQHSAKKNQEMEKLCWADAGIYFASKSGVGGELHDFGKDTRAHYNQHLSKCLLQVVKTEPLDEYGELIRTTIVVYDVSRQRPLVSATSEVRHDGQGREATVFVDENSSKLVGLMSE